MDVFYFSRNYNLLVEIDSKVTIDSKTAITQAGNGLGPAATLAVMAG